MDQDLITFENWYLREILENKQKELVEPSILKRGHYEEQILEYLKYFSIDQLHFVDSQELENNTFNALNRICDFLKISRFKIDDIDLKKFHKRKYSIKLEDKDKDFLNQYYMDKNKQLKKITGIDFKWL